MKTLTSLMMIASMFSFSAKATEGELLSLTLSDGTKVSASEQVRSIVKGDQNRIDSIELINGSVFYDTEISDITIQLDNARLTLPLDAASLNLGNVVFRMGGDGSGGG